MLSLYNYVVVIRIYVKHLVPYSVILLVLFYICYRTLNRAWAGKFLPEWLCLVLHYQRSTLWSVIAYSCLRQHWVQGKMHNYKLCHVGFILTCRGKNTQSTVTTWYSVWYKHWFFYYKGYILKLCQLKQVWHECLASSGTRLLSTEP